MKQGYDRIMGPEELGVLPVGGRTILRDRETGELIHATRTPQGLLRLSLTPRRVVKAAARIIVGDIRDAVNSFRRPRLAVRALTRFESPPRDLTTTKR